MGVDAHQLERLGSGRPAATASAAAPEASAEPELGVLLPGADELVGVGLDARGDPDEHTDRLTATRRRGVGGQDAL